MRKEQRQVEAHASWGREGPDTGAKVRWGGEGVPQGREGGQGRG